MMEGMAAAADVSEGFSSLLKLAKTQSVCFSVTTENCLFAVVFS